MIINLWRIWDIWYEAMARSQDFSAPWRVAGDRRVAAQASGTARREVGHYESMSAAK